MILYIINAVILRVIIKKVQRPSLSERFKSLSEKIEKRFKKEGLKEDVVAEAIKWARR